jgi:arylformamidase
MHLIDITRPVRSGIAVWPGDAAFRMDWTMRVADGASVNLSELHLSAHTGTHADAPFHVADDGRRIGEIPLEAYIGEALVVDATGWTSIGAGPHRAPAARGAAGARPLPDRVLARRRVPRALPRRSSRRPRAPCAAAGVRLVGTDAPSVDPFDSTDLPDAPRLLATPGSRSSRTCCSTGSRRAATS